MIAGDSPEEATPASTSDARRPRPALRAPIRRTLPGVPEIMASSSAPQKSTRRAFVPAGRIHARPKKMSAVERAVLDVCLSAMEGCTVLTGHAGSRLRMQSGSATRIECGANIHQCRWQRRHTGRDPRVRRAVSEPTRLLTTEARPQHLAVVSGSYGTRDSRRCTAASGPRS